MLFFYFICNNSHKYYFFSNMRKSIIFKIISLMYNHGMVFYVIYYHLLIFPKIFRNTKDKLVMFGRQYGFTIVISMI